MVSRSITAAGLIEHFLSSRAPSTMRAYKKDLNIFADFCGAPSIDAAAAELLAMSHGEANGCLLKYRTHMEKKQKLASASVGRRLAAVRALVRLARLLGMIDWMIDVQSPRLQSYRDTRGPGEDVFEKMLADLRARKDSKGLRDFAILRLLHDLALRRGELVSIDIEDLDIEKSMVQLRGKGRTAKELFAVPSPTMDAIKAWLKVRIGQEKALFVSLDHRTLGHRLTTQAVYKIVRTCGHDAGSKVHPHGLRHLAGTTALDRTGGDVRKVAKFMRHKNIQTTMIYDDRRTDEGGNVANLVAGPEPLKKKKK